MKAVLLNTFREIYRNKIIYFAVVFIVVLLVFSIFLGQLSVGNASIVVRDFGLSLLEVFAILYGLFICSEVISKEIETKTIYLLLTKPINKNKILIGKILGSGISFLFIFLIQSIIFICILWYNGYELTLLLYVSLLFIFLTGILFLLTVVCLSLFTSKNLSMLLSICLFIAGRIWFNVEYLFTLGNGIISDSFAKVAGYLLPPYGLINLKESFINTQEVNFSLIGNIIIYYIIYCFILFVITLILFNTKKFD